MHHRTPLLPDKPHLARHTSDSCFMIIYSFPIDPHCVNFVKDNESSNLRCLLAAHIFYHWIQYQYNEIYHFSFNKPSALHHSNFKAHFTYHIWHQEGKFNQGVPGWKPLISQAFFTACLVFKSKPKFPCPDGRPPNLAIRYFCLVCGLSVDSYAFTMN